MNNNPERATAPDPSEVLRDFEAVWERVNGRTADEARANAFTEYNEQENES